MSASIPLGFFAIAGVVILVGVVAAAIVIAVVAANSGRRDREKRARLLHRCAMRGDLRGATDA